MFFRGGALTQTFIFCIWKEAFLQSHSTCSRESMRGASGTRAGHCAPFSNMYSSYERVRHWPSERAFGRRRTACGLTGGSSTKPSIEHGDSLLLWCGVVVREATSVHTYQNYSLIIKKKKRKTTTKRASVGSCFQQCRRRGKA